MSKATLALLVVCAVALSGAAGRVSREPIRISSNSEFTADNGVIAGTGRVGDPYVIAGWDIDAGGERFGILVHHTTRPFMIEDVAVRGARQAGIGLTSTKYGTVRDVEVAGCAIGVSVTLASSITVRDISLRHCDDGIKALYSTDIKVERARIHHAQIGLWASGVTALTLSDSTFRSCHVGVRLDLGSEGNTVAGNAFLECYTPAYSEGGNLFHSEDRGNYWEKHDPRTPYPVEGGDDEDPSPLESPPDTW